MLVLMATRDLTPDERSILELLLSKAFPGNDLLRQQLANVQTSGLSCKCGWASIWLDVDRSVSPTQVWGSINAFGRDDGGNLVDLALHFEGGYLKELDLTDIASMSATGVGLPRAETLSFDEREVLKDARGR
jgi:hypothetical protein